MSSRGLGLDKIWDRARVWHWIWAVAVVVQARPAQATYSIAATDSSTKEVGGAVTSCVGTLDLSLVYGSAPGAGVVHAQASLDNRLRGHDRAIQRLMEGVAPLEIISEITQTSFDSAAASRQYGVVDVMGRSAGYTGTDAMNFRDDRQGNVGSFTYSVQGNILTSRKVLDQAAAAFEGRGCDLAERLMLALEAGAQNGEGDSRCTGGGIPSDSAFIEVDRAGEPAGSYLRLSVSNTKPNSPLPKLRAAFDAWRMMHPCAAMSGGGAGGDGAGMPSAGMSASTGGGCGSSAGACAASAGACGACAVDGGARSCAGAAAAGCTGTAGSSAGAGGAGTGPVGRTGGSGDVAAVSGGISGGAGTMAPAPSANANRRAASGCSLTHPGAQGSAWLLTGWLLVVRKRRRRLRDRGHLQSPADVE